MKRQHVITLLKVVFAIALITWLVGKDRESIQAAIRDIDLSYWLAGAAMVLLGNVIAMGRWHMLMKSAGLDASLFDAIRLGFIGLFFNNVVPGLTGGDLVKAFYVARENPSQRADAVVTVIVDRVIGIVALALIAAVVVLFNLEEYGQIAALTYGFLAVAAFAGYAALSRSFKDNAKRVLPARMKGEEGVLSRIDRAVSLYRSRLPLIGATIGISFLVHGCIIIGISLFGAGIAEGGIAAGSGGVNRIAAFQALADLPLMAYASLVPIIMMISAVPIAPAGWGVGEAAFRYFFSGVGIQGNLAMALSITFRVSTLLLSFIGGAFLVLDRRTPPTSPDVEDAGDGEPSS